MTPLTVTINITDVDETPVVSCGSTGGVDENAS